MGSKLTGNGADNVYAAALRWIHHALQSDGSLFTPAQRYGQGSCLLKFGATSWTSRDMTQMYSGK